MVCLFFACYSFISPDARVFTSCSFATTSNHTDLNSHCRSYCDWLGCVEVSPCALTPSVPLCQYCLEDKRADLEWEESEGDKYGKEVMGVDGRQKKKKWTGRLCKEWENEEKRKEISENKFQNGECVCLDGKMEDAR